MVSDTRLFMFGGGSIFSERDGNARDIMDKQAFEVIQDYYSHDFLEKRLLPTTFKNDFLEQAFKAMIRQEILTDYRESFFNEAADRIRIVGLKKDQVMPTHGIRSALGKASDRILEELDFPFDYSHQVPFPYRSKTDKTLLNESFHSVFGRAASFL